MSQQKCVQSILLDSATLVAVTFVYVMVYCVEDRAVLLDGARVSRSTGQTGEIRK